MTAREGTSREVAILLLRPVLLALVRVLVAEKMRNPSGPRISDAESRLMEEEAPGLSVYQMLRDAKLIEGMPMRLTERGRKVLADRASIR